MDEITIQDLMQDFQEKIDRKDRISGSAMAQSPQYPMLIVFLGKAASKGFSPIASHLFRFWPQFRRELRFLSVEKADGILSYYELTNVKDVEKKELDPDDVEELASGMYSTRLHFKNRNNFLVYFVLDTTPFRKPEEYTEWLEVIPEIKADLNVEDSDLLDLLVLLLNEKRRKEVARQIRNLLCEFYSRKKNPVKSILLMSNLLGDGATLDDWTPCYGITAATIAFSNSEEARNTQTMFAECIHTVGYAEYSKPVENIAQVMVTRLIDRLSEELDLGKTNIHNSPDLPKRLGIREDGTICKLDEYAETELIPLLPTEDQLAYFPRKNNDAWDDVAAMSAREFDEFTMGAWNCYLNRIVNRVSDKLRNDVSMHKLWSEDFTSYLAENFSTSELIDLAEHPDAVSNLFQKRSYVDHGERVLDAAALQLKFKLSNDTKVVSLMTDAVTALGENAKNFRTIWMRLIESRNDVHMIEDSSVNEFYGSRFRSFFDNYGTGLCRQFRMIQDMQQMEDFLQKTLDQMVDYDNTYRLSCLDELQERLKAKGAQFDVRQYIRQRLTGESLHQYFQVSFGSLSHPIYTALLADSEVSNYLGNILEVSANYNSGSSDVIEVLQLYEVPYDRLIN